MTYYFIENIHYFIYLFLIDRKVWVRSSKPYSISLSLRKLQKILMKDQPMDRDCFNLAVRKFAYDDIQLMKKNRGTISKHYLDLQFWV